MVSPAYPLKYQNRKLDLLYNFNKYNENLNYFEQFGSNFIYTYRPNSMVSIFDLLMFVEVVGHRQYSKIFSLIKGDRKPVIQMGREKITISKSRQQVIGYFPLNKGARRRVTQLARGNITISKSR